MVSADTFNFTGTVKTSKNGGRLTQGADHRVVSTYPYDVTGYTAKLQVRNSIKTVLIELSSPSDNATITATPTTSDIALHFTKTKTNITPGIFDYDLIITDSIGTPYCILEGKLEIYRRITV